MYSTLNRIEHELRGVLGRVETPGYTEDNEDVRVASKLMGDIRDAVTDYQVSCYPNPFPPTISSGDWSRPHTSRLFTTRISNSL